MANRWQGLLGRLNDPQVRSGLLAAAAQMQETGAEGGNTMLGLTRGMQGYQAQREYDAEQQRQLLRQQQDDEMRQTEFGWKREAYGQKAAMRQQIREMYRDDPVLGPLAEADPDTAIEIHKSILTAKPRANDLQTKMADLQEAGISPNSPQGQKYLGMYIDPTGGRAPDDGYHPPIATNQGFLQFDPATRSYVPIRLGDQTVLPPSIDPNIQGDVSRARAEGREFGEAGAGAAINLPTIEATASQTIGMIDNLLKKDSGLDTIAGLSGTLGVAARVPGSQAADAKVKLDQLKGRAFLQVYDQLRGAGQITEIEGQKGEAAYARLNTAQSDKEMRAALKEMKEVVDAGLTRARKKAQGAQRPAAPAAHVAPAVVNFEDLP